MNRRGFLQAILAAGVAPAVVGSGILMPVRAIALPEWGISRVAMPDVIAAQKALNALDDYVAAYGPLPTAKPRARRHVSRAARSSRIALLSTS